MIASHSGRLGGLALRAGACWRCYGVSFELVVTLLYWYDFLREQNGRDVCFSGKTAPTPSEVSVGFASLSADSLVDCPVGAVAGSIITILNCSILCCIVLEFLLGSGTDNCTIYEGDREDNCEHSVLSVVSKTVLASLLDQTSQSLVCDASTPSVMLFRFTSKCESQRFLVACCEGKSDGLSLVIVNHNAFAGFSDAGLRCVIRGLRIGGSIATSWDTIYNDLINRFVLSHISNTDRLHEFPSGNHKIVHRAFVFSLAKFQNGQVPRNGCGDGILCVWDLEQEEYIQSRSDYAGAILMLAVYKVSRGSLLFPFCIMAQLRFGYGTETRATAVPEHFGSVKTITLYWRGRWLTNIWSSSESSLCVESWNTEFCLSISQMYKRGPSVMSTIAYLLQLWTTEFRFEI